MGVSTGKNYAEPQGGCDERKRIHRFLPIILHGVLLGMVGCGIGLSGRIYSLEDGIVLPLEIETSYGFGEIRCSNQKTGEHFEGTYSAVSEGAVGIAGSNVMGSAYSSTGQSVRGSATGLSHAFLQSMTANAIATMIGNRGTVLDCRMEIQKGFRPHGMGGCVDNAGKTYRLQF
jgi:hypothetical protein